MAAISLKIRILDKEYQVNCKPDEREALERSAELLNDKMEEIRQGSHIIGLERIAVMAALNLSHDLIRIETVPNRMQKRPMSYNPWIQNSILSSLTSVVNSAAVFLLISSASGCLFTLHLVFALLHSFSWGVSQPRSP